MSQKQIIKQAIIEVIGSINGKVILTKEQTKQILDIISFRFVEEKAISEKAMIKYVDVAGVRKYYAAGVLNNWLYKDPELNGGIKYEVKTIKTEVKVPKLQHILNLIKQYETSGEIDKVNVLKGHYNKQINKGEPDVT